MNFVNFTIGSTGSAPQTWLSTILPGLTVALVAGIVLFALNWAREWITAHLKRKSEAEVLAFTLVTEFDRLIAACAEVVDDPCHMDQTTGIWETTVKTPWIEWPDSWNWSSFPKRLQYRVRSIPNKIYLANRSVSSLWEYGDGPPDYSDAFEERSIRYAWIGLEAVVINEILARDYGVPLLDRGDWDPAERFKFQIDKIEKERAIEKAHPWPVPDFMLPKVPIEELQARHAKLTVDLEAAIKNRRQA
ncbi:hypothetical protein O9X99_02070 [Agrobacterium salinitolerans]|uniref:DUF4760 domain-containing protein n=1 Tax=Agrobacterium salinitolerans TaxID=1183413 RepID=A0ABY3BVJ5_9HYPH|nr:MULTISPECIES: hypothetical protein [Agrobacterium]MCZ7890454.1 hypothetical protein [Agrobacterium salinitolerans]TRA96824.1 hypothetical protein EXN23_00885 [Agrobacterium salinitolerans]